jgi:hypothetical protein
MKRAISATRARHAAGSATGCFAVAVARAIDVRTRAELCDAVAGAGAADAAVLAAAEFTRAGAGALQVTIVGAHEPAIARRRTDAVIARTLALAIFAVAADVVVVLAAAGACDGDQREEA